MKPGKVLVLLAVILIFSAFTYSQEKYTPEQEKVRDYLQKSFENNYQYFADLHNEFADFLPLDGKMEKELKNSFPMYKFFIAETYYSHYMPRDNKAAIMVVTKAETGEVIGHRWALWYGGYSESFGHILELVQFESKDDAKAKVKLISELIVSIGRGKGKVGEIKIKDKLISADLDDNWRVMKVALKKDRFGQITFFNPKMKENDVTEEERNRNRRKVKE